MSVKLDLMDEMYSVLNPRKTLNLNYFLYIFLVLSFVCMFLFPKIYIQQQIYFKSRDISKLSGEYEILKEENRLISASVESIRFKNQILDTLF